MIFRIFTKSTGTAALAIFTVILSGLIFWRISYAVAGFGTKISIIDSQIAVLESKRAASRAGDAIFKEKRPEFERMNRFFVDSERPVEFIETIEGLAAKTVVRLRLDFDPAGSAKKELVFRIAAEGPEKNLRRLFKLLELAPYAIKVESFGFQKISRAETGIIPAGKPGLAGQIPTHRLTLSIKVKTAFYAEP